MKQPHERGELGAWLVEQRQRLSEEQGRRVTQQVVVDGLVAQGDPIDASYYRAIEAGKKAPGKEVREALARYFGRTPPTAGPRTGEPTDLGRLAAAIEAQTASIDRLITALAAQDDQAQAEALGEALATHLAPLLAAMRDGQPVGGAQ